MKSKLPHPAQAQDLYTSALFRKERAYAEGARVPWFVLSAEHGLVAPGQVLEPYDLRLSRTTRDYRRAWGARVTKQLQDAVGPLANKRIEIHAGSAYVDAIRAGLLDAGAEVIEPLTGLTMGERLAWYGSHIEPTPPAGPSPAVGDLVVQLEDGTGAQSPADFLATDGTDMRAPGLYSWWVDTEGAAELERGLGHPMRAGLIYAGLAGATRSRSGRKSSNTLWGRIRGMHLGGRHEFSTFRLSLGSVLAAARDESEIDEGRLTCWMHAHLRIVALAVEDADALDGLETEVLAVLDPPLNLSKMAKTNVRRRLTGLRRLHGRRSQGRGAVSI